MPPFRNFLSFSPVQIAARCTCLFGIIATFGYCLALGKPAVFGGIFHHGVNFSRLNTVQKRPKCKANVYECKHFVLISLLMADTVGKSLKQKTSCFMLSTLSLAALMQFCGYSKTYALDLLLLQLYVLSVYLAFAEQSAYHFPDCGNSNRYCCTSFFHL